MSLKLGIFEVSYGTPKWDGWRKELNIQPGRVSFYLGTDGGPEDTYINTVPEKTIADEGGSLWRVPSIAVGGNGATRYRYGNNIYEKGTFSIFYDNGIDGEDWLLTYSSANDVIKLFDLDSRHLYLGFRDGGTIIVLDAFSEAGSIEKYFFREIVVDGAPNELRSFVNQYGNRQGETFDGMVSRGELNLEVLGLYGGSEEINTIVDTLRISDFHSYDSSFGDRRSNRLFAGPEKSLIRAMSGDDYLVGGASNDKLYGDDGNDVIDGSEGSDILDGGPGDDYIIGGAGIDADYIFGGFGKDLLGGGGGPDHIYGQDGDDEIRAGHGKDVISGGSGADVLYGGGGGNLFEPELDGSIDNLYIMSDFRGHEYEWGRNHGGINADVIKELDSDDRITILGTSQPGLSFRDVTAGTYNQAQAGIGIFDGEMLEALYVGSNLNAGQLAAITTADPSRFW